MKNLKTFVALTVIVTQVCWPMISFANPIGENVTAGSATFDRTLPDTLIVNQATDRLITQWNDFSIAAHETTQFIQPSSSSIALNRVVGGNPSNIFGNLNANGRVFLINQNGILFAPGSQVNVGGLIASSLNISDSNFLSSNNLSFTGASGFGSVINRGRININAPGGYAALLGSTVLNAGPITTNVGTVALASGNKMTVDLDPAGTISAVVVDEALDTNLSGNVNATSNSGHIITNGGTVILTAKSLQGLFSNLINNYGIIEAEALSSHDGVVQLTVAGGELRNTGYILADRIQAQAVDADFHNQGSLVAHDTINIIADRNINLPGGSIVVDSATGGSVNLEGANVNIGGVVLASNGDVTVTAHDQILNIGGPTAGNIITTHINLSAVNGIGSTDAMNIQTDTLNAANSSHGVIKIQGTNSFTANSIVNNGGASGDDIFINTTQGIARDIEVGTISAAGAGQVNLDASGSITDTNADSMVIADKVNLTANNAIGSSSNRINTDANDIAGLTKDAGSIYLNQAHAVTLSNLHAHNGLIDIIADGKINAVNVSTTGTAADSITLKTTSGDIEAGAINAAGGLADVNLDAAASITDTNGDSLITSNNFNFTAGNVVGTAAGVSLQIVGGHVVLNIQNTSDSATYNVYSRASLTDPWQLVATNYAASGAATTQWTDPAALGASSFYKVEIASASASDVGSSVNRINTNVNTITGVSQSGTGDIYLNQAQAVTLANIHNDNGVIDVTAAGAMNAANVSTSGGSGDSIVLQTTTGDIEVGAINAAGGLADVNLDAAASIADTNGDSLITSNNFNFTAGNVVGTAAGVSLQIVGGHVVLNIQNTSDSATYNVYSRASLTDPWQLVATNYAASGTATTQWTDPAALGASSFYKVETASATVSGVGTSANRINTNVNTVTGLSKVGTGGIYLNQAKAVTLNNLRNESGLIDVIASGNIVAGNVNATGDVLLNSVNGSIVGTGTGTHVTSQGDTHLHAGNLIGSWNPYVPLNINVGGDLYLGIAQRDSLANGSVGDMPVSGTLAGTVAGVNHFDPGTHDPYNLANTTFHGNPPGYIFLNNIEIWPNLSLPTPVVISPLTASFAAEVPNTLQLNQKAYYEILNPHLVRQMEVAEQTTIYAYHSLVETDNSAFDDIKLDPAAYDYIDGRINIDTPAVLTEEEDKQ